MFQIILKQRLYPLIYFFAVLIITDFIIGPFDIQPYALFAVSEILLQIILTSPRRQVSKIQALFLKWLKA